MVFPWVRQCQEDVANLPSSATDVGGQKFLDFLVFLRRVVLQDAVLLRQQYPTLELFQHEIFASDLFTTYANQLTEIMEITPEPHCASITRVVPELGIALTSLQAEVQALTVAQRLHLTSQNKLVSSIAALSKQAKEAERQSRTRDALTQEEVRRIGAFCTYIGDFRQHYERQVARRTETTDTRHGQGMANSNEEIGGRAISNEEMGGTANSNDEMGGNFLQEADIDMAIENQDNDDAQEINDTIQVDVDAQEIQQALHHKVKQNVDNIRDLWREWTTGVDGNPAISKLEATWGPAWQNWSRKAVNSVDGK